MKSDKSFESFDILMCYLLMHLKVIKLKRVLIFLCVIY